MYHIDQDFYKRKIKQTPSDAEFSKIDSTRMKLSGLANTRPDIVLESSQTAQVARDISEKDIPKSWKRLNEDIKH